MIRCVVDGDRVLRHTHIAGYRYETTGTEVVVDLNQEWPKDRDGEPIHKWLVHYDGTRVVPGPPVPTLRERKAAIRADYDIWDLIEDQSKLDEYRARIAQL